MPSHGDVAAVTSGQRGIVRTGRTVDSHLVVMALIPGILGDMVIESLEGAECVRRSLVVRQYLR